MTTIDANLSNPWGLAMPQGGPIWIADNNSNVATLYDGLAARGFKLGPEHGPVVGVHLPDRMTAIGFWRAMLDAGIYVNVAVPPATPNGVSLLRCSLCAVHTKEQLEHMIEVMTGIGRQMGVLAPKLRAAG